MFYLCKSIVSYAWYMAMSAGIHSTWLVHEICNFSNVGRSRSHVEGSLKNNAIFEIRQAQRQQGCKYDFPFRAIAQF